VIRLSKNARFAEEQGGGVILDIRNDRFFDLNATGASIWRLAALGEPVDRIALLIAAEANVETSCVHQDVADFLNVLAGLDLIKLEDEIVQSLGAAQ
jgi:hypothetical protein